MHRLGLLFIAMNKPAHTPASDSSPAAAHKVTPMMAQYLEIKQANPDSLLFYRMGDFYELFFKDAEVASAALGIALTKRGKHLGDDIPMCGVPVHAADDYLQKLIRLGHRVAVCEQTEDPAEAKKRGSKAVVRRDVVRLVTPGTLTEENLLQSGRNNYLAALSRVRSSDGMALAWLDMSTGEFEAAPVTPVSLLAELARLAPSELLVPDSLLADGELSHMLEPYRPVLTPLPAARFDSASAQARLCDYYKVASLDAYGSFDRALVAACGALLEYVELTQVGKLPALQPPSIRDPGHTVLIDAATRANLELAQTLAGSRKGSLLDVVDFTVTGAGSRLLAGWLAAPLTGIAAISSRHDAVEAFTDEAGQEVAGDVRATLRQAPDISRALSRLTLGRGSPRDLAAIASGLHAAARLADRFSHRAGIDPWPTAVANVWSALSAADTAFADHLSAMLAEELPATTRDGGFIRAGADEALDENRALRDESRKVIASLQARYAEETGLKSLKIKHNNMLGYFIELNQQSGETLLGEAHAGQFIHRQTMANAMRFTTTELTGLEQKILAAADRARAIELEIFDRLLTMVGERAGMLQSVARALSELDVFTALAELAVRLDYVRPHVDQSRKFEIEGGRHPVVEAAIRRQDGAHFVPNDCSLTAGETDADGEATRHIKLITGPNMAGKSTYLRQNAIIALLAQAGSFVPAAAAHIGVVDRVFSRVGAADDLARGRSTFMVEMVETATILNLATERSLVILDEIGRGTATYDGLSIAWACVEHLHGVNRCRALFATHFHELTALSSRLDSVANATVKVREWQGEVIFLHEVVPGAADRSYGIQVARLAGLPPAVIDRATEVLHLLEQSEQSEAHQRIIDDLPLFSSAQRPASSARPQMDDATRAVIDALAETLPDELSPRDALELVYKLKALAGSGGNG
jgi:DNA mismatch repair protein MutS